MKWWNTNQKKIPFYGNVVKMIFSLSPSSTSIERAYFKLDTIFDDQQTNSRKELIHITLQNSINERKYYEFENFKFDEKK